MMVVLSVIDFIQMMYIKCKMFTYVHIISVYIVAFNINAWLVFKHMDLVQALKINYE